MYRDLRQVHVISPQPLSIRDDDLRGGRPIVPAELTGLLHQHLAAGGLHGLPALIDHALNEIGPQRVQILEIALYRRRRGGQRRGHRYQTQ